MIGAAQLDTSTSAAASPLRYLDMVAMVGEPPPPVPWLAPPVLPRASLAALFAPGGDGKSLLAAALACAIREGGEIAAIACEKGTTLYLDGENGEHEIWRRVHTLGMPATGVQVIDASGFDLRTHLDLLREAILEHRPDLVVLDSFRSLTPGLDENDTKQTSSVIDPLRRLFHELGPAGLLIHHTNKAGKDFRGASSIRDSVDVLWHLGRHEGDQDTTRRFLACRKMRVAAEPERIWLRLAIDRGRVLIDRAEPPEDNGPAQPAQPVRAMLSDQILDAMNGTPLRLSEIAGLVGRQPKDGSVRNALAALVGDGLVSRDGTTYTKVQVQSDPIAPLHHEVQSAIPLKGNAPLHPAELPYEIDTTTPAKPEAARRCECERPVLDADRTCGKCGRIRPGNAIDCEVIG